MSQQATYNVVQRTESFPHSMHYYLKDTVNEVIDLDLLEYDYDAPEKDPTSLYRSNDASEEAITPSTTASLQPISSNEDTVSTDTITEEPIDLDLLFEQRMQLRHDNSDATQSENNFVNNRTSPNVTVTSSSGVNSQGERINNSYQPMNANRHEGATQQIHSTRHRNVEDHEVHYKHQMKNARRREDREHPQPIVSPTAVLIPTTNANRPMDNDIVTDQEVIRPRLNISQLVVRYGTDGGEDNNVDNTNVVTIMNDNHHEPSATILPIAAEVVMTPPLAVATPMRSVLAKKHVIGIILLCGTVVIIVAVVLAVVVLSDKQANPSTKAPTPSPPTSAPAPARTSSPVSSFAHIQTLSPVTVATTSFPTPAPVQPTSLPPIVIPCFENSIELRSSVNAYLAGNNQGYASYGNDIGSWCVSKVNDMSRLFYEASSFNEDISSWDVSSVTDMSNMFQKAYKFNQSLSTWDVSKVTNMFMMFEDASSFNQDLSLWDVSRVTNMTVMFRNAYSFNQDLSTWDVSRVTDMRSMFTKASSFNQDLSSWNVTSVTEIFGMFQNATSMNQNLCAWKTRLPTSAHVRNMFENTSCPEGLKDPQLSSDSLQWIGPFCYPC